MRPLGTTQRQQQLQHLVRVALFVCAAVAVAVEAQYLPRVVPALPAVCWGGASAPVATPPPGVVFTQLTVGSCYASAIQERPASGGGTIYAAHQWGLSSSISDEGIEYFFPINNGFTAPRWSAFEDCSDSIEFCGMKSDGYLYCHVLSSSIAVGPFAQYAMEGGVSCGVLLSNGNIKCWESGRGSLYPMPGQPLDPNVGYVQVSKGFKHACAIRQDNRRVQCWGGFDDQGQISQTPTDVSFSTICSGEYYTCGLLSANGKARCWGEAAQFAGLPTDEAFTSLACGFRHVCALNSAGNPRCGGEDSAIPQVYAAYNFARLAAGQGYTCGLGTAPSPSPSPTSSPSPSSTPTPSLSNTPSPSPTPSTSLSPSPTPSTSPSPSPSPSISLSPTPSTSRSASPTPSTTPSASPTPSTSRSPSASPSSSPSPSVTPSASLSPSVSPSVSVTPSTSPSASGTPSASPTSSVTPSVSSSPSASRSPSLQSLSSASRPTASLLIHSLHNALSALWPQ